MAISKQSKVLIISAGLLLLAGSVVGVGAVTSIEDSQTEECHHEEASEGHEPHEPHEDSDEDGEPGKCLGPHEPHEDSDEDGEPGKCLGEHSYGGASE